MTSNLLIKGDTYRDRSFVILTATRGVIHEQAYVSHLAMLMPQNVKHARVVASGHEVGHAYNALTDAALKMGSTYAVTLEDDMLPPDDGIERLMGAIERTDLDAVSALYRTKGERSWPLVLGHPTHNLFDHSPRAPIHQDLIDRGEDPVMEVNCIPMGFAIWKMRMFRELKVLAPGPLFRTTQSTQDTNFARLARERGYRFGVDCSIKVGHLDVSDGKVY